MVTYGGWTQDVNYTTFRTFDTIGTEDYTQQTATYGHETPYQTPVYSISEADLQVSFDLAQLALNQEGAWVEYLSSGYALSFPDWKSDWAVRIWARTMHIGGWENWYNPPNYGSTPPEGAIGIDYENQPYNPDDPWAFALADVQTLHLGVESNVEGQFQDDQVANGELLPWSMQSTLYIRPPASAPVEIATLNSPANDTASNWLEMNLAAPIDLAPYGALDSDGWTADLFTRTTPLIVGGDPAPYNTTFTRYGWMVNSMRLNATVRPPLYRWVYEGGNTYRRNFPRDDGLAGGARRNYPPSRAVQSGIRNVGGYL